MLLRNHYQPVEPRRLSRPDFQQHQYQSQLVEQEEWPSVARLWLLDPILPKYCYRWSDVVRDLKWYDIFSIHIRWRLDAHINTREKERRLTYNVYSTHPSLLAPSAISLSSISMTTALYQGSPLAMIRVKSNRKD